MFLFPGFWHFSALKKPFFIWIFSKMKTCSGRSKMLDFIRTAFWQWFRPLCGFPGASVEKDWSNMMQDSLTRLFLPWEAGFSNHEFKSFWSPLVWWGFKLLPKTKEPGKSQMKIGMSEFSTNSEWSFEPKEELCGILGGFSGDSAFSFVNLPASELDEDFAENENFRSWCRLLKRKNQL